MMITIIIGNSYSTIKGLNPKQEKGLKDALSYTIGGSSAYFSGYGIRKRSLLSKTCTFPTGLLDRVQDYLTTQGYGIPVSAKITGPSLGPVTTFAGAYKWQVEALHHAATFGRGIISAPTGSGKSRIIKMIAKHFGLKTLIVVPSLEIKRQLAETLKELPNITVENIDSKALNKLTNFDVLIIDEGHHVAAKTYHKLNKTAWTGIYYRFFLTATPFRNDAEETLLFESIAGKVIYQLDYPTAVKNKYIVPLEAYYIDVPKQPTDAVTYKEVYSKLVVNNEHRNHMISVLLLQLNASSVASLCLVREVAHGKLLADITGFPFISGADDDSRQYIKQFNNGHIKTLIGTTGILGEGIDTKPAEYIVIAGLGKAKSQFMQQVGRGVRIFMSKESAKIIIMKDKSHRFTMRHFNEQKRILFDEYGVKPIKLDL